MLINRRGNWYLLIGGGLVVLLLLVVLVFSDRSGATPDTGTAVLAPDDAAAEQFSILSSPIASAVPAENRSGVDSLTEGTLPGNSGPAEVSAVGTVRAAGGNDVTVASVGGSVCAVHAMDSGCGLVDDVADGRLIGARPRSCGYYWVFGLAPDGVKEIEVDQGKDGDIDRAIPVIGNVFEGVLEAVPTSINGVDGAGKTMFETNVPLDYFAATNDACK
ncbi:MAG: hypothetical protein R2725_04510 [Solirubrobacterales bacterium]